MSILSDFEDRIAGAVEGLFAGAFRSPVQPAEIAKALGRAMDDGRVVGVGRVYVPVSYGVAIAEEDAGRFGGFTATLGGELSTFLAARARERGYHLPSKPTVEFVVHDDLKVGQFRVRAEMAPAEEAEEEVVDLLRPAPHPAPAMATVTVEGTHHDVALRGERVVVGRLSSSDLPLDDANVSREHAAFVAEGVGWAVEDLGSTNGTTVNGERVERRRLREGDVVQIGLTRLVYHEPQP